MNAHFFCFLIIAIPLLGQAQSTKDPFAAVEEISVDRSSDKKSDQFLASELLRAFEEPRLDKGTVKGQPLIRITVLRSFHAPLMFKWYPADPGEESRLEVKRLKQVIDINGKKSFLGLDLYQNLKLRPSQELILKEIHQHSTLQSLPQKDWQPKGLDGSTWIYEAAAEGGSVLIERSSPINPFLGDTKISNERLSKELQLTSFSLMLWTLSGIDEIPY